MILKFHEKTRPARGEKRRLLFKEREAREYRYHGYDVNGNPLTNLNFGADSVVTKIQ